MLKTLLKTSKEFPNRWVNLMLVFLIPLPGMGIDLIAPSLPSIASYFHVHPSFSKLMISIYMLSYGVGLGVFGIASDYVSRRPIILAGLFGYLLTCYAASHAASITQLLSLRAAQGITASAFLSLARTMLIELTPDDQLHVTSTWISAAWGIGPVIAPMIGGYLQHYFGWQANFLFYVAYAAVFLVIYFLFLPENKKPVREAHAHKILQTIVIVFRAPIFWGCTLMMGFYYAFFIIFNTLGPFAIQGIFGKSALFYGNVALVLGLVFFFSSILLVKKLIVRFNKHRLMNVANYVSILIVLLALIFTHWNRTYDLWIFLAVTAILYFTVSYIYPLCMSIFLSVSRELPGTYNALNLLILILITSVSSGLASFLPMHHWQVVLRCDLVLLFFAVVVYQCFLSHRKL